MARPARRRRRAETADAEATVAAAGYRVARISEPGTLDGGDVLKVGSTIYVGLTERTNAAAPSSWPALRPAGRDRGPGPDDQGAAPEERGHRAAGRHG